MLGRWLLVGMVLTFATAVAAPLARVSPSRLPGFAALAPAIDCYAVSGVDADDIAASLRSAGPVERDGTRREGLMRWKLDWSWPTSDGNPIYSASTVRLDTQITAPCLEADGRRAAALETRFAEYRAAIIAHEMKHHAIASEEAARLSAQLRALPPATDVSVGQRLGRRALGRITARNEAFDVESKHGRSTGVRW